MADQSKQHLCPHCLTVVDVLRPHLKKACMKGCSVTEVSSVIQKETDRRNRLALSYVTRKELEKFADVPGPQAAEELCKLLGIPVFPNLMAQEKQVKSVPVTNSLNPGPMNSHTVVPKTSTSAIVDASVNDSVLVSSSSLANESSVIDASVQTLSPARKKLISLKPASDLPTFFATPFQIASQIESADPLDQPPRKRQKSFSVFSCNTEVPSSRAQVASANVMHPEGNRSSSDLKQLATNSQLPSLSTPVCKKDKLEACLLHSNIKADTVHFPKYRAIAECLGIDDMDLEKDFNDKCRYERLKARARAFWDSFPDRQQFLDESAVLKYAERFCSEQGYPFDAKLKVMIKRQYQKRTPPPSRHFDHNKAELDKISAQIKSQRWPLLAIRAMGGSKGKGVIANADIPNGTVLCDYHGALLSESEGQSKYDSLVDGNHYMFKFHHKGSVHWIDGVADCPCHKYNDTLKGRKLNHANTGELECNARPIVRVIDSRPCLIFYSIKYIKQYQEISFDYGCLNDSQSTQLPWMLRELKRKK